MAALSLLALFMYLRQTATLDRALADEAERIGGERDRLEQEVAARTAQLKELAQHLQTIREDERSRLARELHDELGALLTAAKLDVARLKSRLGASATRRMRPSAWPTSTRRSTAASPSSAGSSRTCARRRSATSAWSRRSRSCCASSARAARSRWSTGSSPST